MFFFNSINQFSRIIVFITRIYLEKPPVTASSTKTNNSQKKLNCGSHACPKCGHCRDWYWKRSFLVIRIIPSVLMQTAFLIFLIMIVLMVIGIVILVMLVVFLVVFVILIFLVIFLRLVIFLMVFYVSALTITHNFDKLGIDHHTVKFFVALETVFIFLSK